MTKRAQQPQVMKLLSPVIGVRLDLIDIKVCYFECYGKWYETFLHIGHQSASDRKNC